MNRFISSCVHLLVIALYCLTFTSSLYANEALSQFSSLAAEADPHTGSANMGVNIAVPSGRGGIQPNLALAYNSSSGNGPIGMGWNMEIGSIRRLTRHGVPSYNDNTDTFTLIQNGSAHELIYDSASGFYRGKIEGAFLKVEKISDYWVVTDRNGTTYQFGNTADSREYDPQDSSKIFKWCLNRVEDVHGNYMTYEYVRDDNKIYISEIEYTGNSNTSLSPYARVNFTYETRADGGINFYNAGFRQATNKRLMKINTYADDELQRSYKLDYTLSEETSRSLLNTVTQYDSNESMSLPPVTFTYQKNPNTPSLYNIVSMTSTPPQTGDNQWNRRITDHYFDLHDNYGPVPPPFMGFATTVWGDTTQIGNADGSFSYNGQQDKGYWYWTYVYVPTAQNLNVSISTNHSNYGVWINGAYSSAKSTTWPLKAGYNLIEITDYNQNTGFNFSLNTNLSAAVDVVDSSQLVQPQLSGDVNADGYSDIIHFDSVDGDVKVALSNGSNFQVAENWMTGLASTDKVMIADFDGNGRMDMVSFTPSTGTWKVGISDGTTFGALTTWRTGWGANGDPTVGDFNGDGKSDIATFYESGGTRYARIALNSGSNTFTHYLSGISVGDAGTQTFAADFNGDGQIDFGSFKASTGTWKFKINQGANYSTFTSLDTVTGFGTNRSIVMADFNHDGLTDIGYYEYGNGQIVYRKSNGVSFGVTTEVPVDFSLTSTSTSVLTSDFNGDTLVDFAAFDGISDSEIAFTTGVAADLLSKSDNGIGGETDITYYSKVNCNNTYLPFPIQVIGTITKSERLGESYTITYDYKLGLWDVDDREFRGFGQVTVIDPDGNYTVSKYLQDNTYKGRQDYQETYDADDNLYSKTDFTWDVEAINADIDFVYLSRKDNYVYDTDATPRRTAEEYFYGEATQLGNLTKVVQYGEVDADDGTDIGSDTRTVETAYVNNTTDRILGLPRLVTVKDNNGTAVRKTWFYYYGAASNTATPSAGLLTKKEDWGGDDPDDENPETAYTYDAYGNLKTTTDPLNNTTSITYDTDYHIYPLVTTNALGHAVTNIYYGIDGIPLSGSGYNGLWGQLKSTTDPNDQTGSRVYDSFGRLTKTISPMDSIDYPTTEMSYDLGNASFSRVITESRLKHGQSQTLKSYAFYDGFGRLIYNKAPSETAGEYIVSGATEYNSRGLASVKYSNFICPNAPYLLSDAPIGTPKVTITYDAMGRVVQTTNPDNTYSSVSYDKWTTETINENGHKQQSDFDAYGRLIEKREYTGADGRSADYPANGYALYATTNYEYDSEGNLTKTIDDADNETVITYDELGRKVQMDDPDMGVWTYDYDLNGNLIVQTDAKNQTINFTYDALNRLINKTDGANLDVDYTYDDASVNYSKGRLTEAGYGAENTEFAYDVLGREIQSVKKVGGEFFNVERAYDAMSRLNSVEYPDAANVVYTYNAAGQIIGVGDGKVGGDQVLGGAELLYHLTLNDAGTVGDAIEDVADVPLPGNEEVQMVADGNYDLLLHMDGAHASTNIVDETGNTVTVYGDAQLTDTTNQFGWTSIDFDGGNDYVTVADDPAWDFFATTTGSKTLDFWINFDNNGNSPAIFSQGENTANYWYLGYNSNGFELKLRTGGVNVATTPANNPIANGSWHHVAIIKVNNKYGVYVDGNQIGYMSYNTAVNFNGPLYIGTHGQGIWGDVDGKIDEFRVYNGNPFEAAPNSAKTDSFSTPTAAYDMMISVQEQIASADGITADTDLMLHADGAHASTDITDIMGKTVTAHGNSHLTTTQQKFGTASINFDGNDYLTVADDPAWDFFSSTTGTKTLDFWMRFDDNSNAPAIFSQGENSSNYWYLGYNPNGFEFKLRSGGKNVAVIDTLHPINNGSWHHVAVIKVDNAYGIYVDGSQVGYIEYNTTANFTGPLYIGDHGNANIHGLKGQIDEFRVHDGNPFTATPNSNETDIIGVYTSAYAIASTGGEQTAVTPGITDDTDFMMHGNGADASTTITDETGKAIMVEGNAQLTVTDKKSGTASVTFDGGNDYLTIADDPAWDFFASTTETKTLDFWIKIDTDTSPAILSQGENSSNYWYLGYNSSGFELKLRHNGKNVAVTPTAIPAALGTWHHVAIIKVGHEYGVYLNGQQSGYMSYNQVVDFTGALYIGTHGQGIWGDLDGKIDEFRIHNDNAFNASPNVFKTDTITVPQGEYAEAATVTDHMLMGDSTESVTADLLINADGAHTSTAITDEMGGTINVMGSTQLTTTYKKFGTASMTFDGNDYLTVADDPAWDFFGSTTGTKTLDFWMRFDNNSNAPAIFSQGENSSNYWYLGYNPNGFELKLRSGGRNVAFTSAAGAFANGSWHHVAVIKVNNEYGVYVDGNQVGYMTYNTPANFTGPLYIGDHGNVGIHGLKGQLDDFRVVSGNPFEALPNSAKSDSFTVPAIMHGTTESLSTTGKIGTAIAFDGVSQYVDMDASAQTIEGRTTGSMALWVKADTLQQATLYSVSKQSESGALEVSTDTSGRFVFKLDNKIYAKTPATSYSAGNWVHLAWIQDGANITAYVDGVAQTLSHEAGYSDYGAWVDDLGEVDHVRLGSLQHVFFGNQDFFTGAMDDFRFYDQALSEEEVGAIYNSGVGTEDASVLEIDDSEAAASEVYVSNIDYNTHGQITSITFGNGAVTTYTYDADNLRLTRVLTKDDIDTAIQDLNYTYDAIGNVLSIVDNTGTDDQTFAYDAINRLINASGSYGNKTYAYDTIGNITSKDGRSYTYGEGGAGPHAVTSLSDGTTFTYDANGNMATRQIGATVTYYTYDTENRLLKIEENDGSGLETIATYAYDGDGGRVSKNVGAATTKFVGGMFEDASDGRETKYVYLGSQRIAQITQKALTTTTMFYHTNHLGSAHVMTNGDGDVKEIIEYDPWGKRIVHDKYGDPEEVAWHYFTGHYEDDESGLIFMQARYYDPSLGKFITPDSFVQDPGGNPQTLNRYSYTGNNPVNYTDPTGHFFGFIIAAIVKAVTAAATYVAAHATAIATGALVGGVVGGTASAVMGGNFWQGAAIGAIGGAVFAGVAPGFSGLFKTALTGTSKISLIGGAATVESFTTGFLAGAASGAATSAYVGADIGNGALTGGAFAVASVAVFRTTGKYMREKMWAQSVKNNSGGDSIGHLGGGRKLGGFRRNLVNQKGWFGRNFGFNLGGSQGGPGQLGVRLFGKDFLYNYSKGSIPDFIVEMWSGPHDYFNSWTYESAGKNIGNIRALSSVEQSISGVTNVLNVAIAAPIAIESTFPGVTQVSVYGVQGLQESLEE